MIQIKIFVGTLSEIEAAFNAFAPGIVQGAQLNCGPCVAAPDGSWFKEVMMQLPVRDNGKIAIPQMEVPRGR